MNERLVSINSGDTVYGSDGNKIGSVKECTDRFCHVDTGFLGLGQDYYIPIDAIESADSGEVRLRATSDDLGRNGWDQKPEDLGRPTTDFRQFQGYQDVRTSGEAMSEPYSRTGEYEEAPRDEGFPAPENRSMPLAEEELNAHPTRESAGEVEVGKHIEEERRTMNVPVSHEEVVVRQRSVDEPTDRPVDEGETIRIPLEEEHVVTDKETHVYGEVEIEKRKVTENQEVSDTVRREVPDVNKKGDVDEYVDEEGLTREERMRRDRAA